MEYRKAIRKIIGFAMILGILVLGACKIAKKKSLNTVEVSKVKDTTMTYILNDTLKSLNQKNSSEISIAYIPTTKDYYEKAYDEIQKMLEGSQPLDFKKAVFITENAYFNNQMDYGGYEKVISGLTEMCRKWMFSNYLKNYHYSDSINFKKNAAIFSMMKDTVYLVDGIPLYEPYRYDFESSISKDWSAQFVTRLLVSGTGNCHSLPYLYKILANELKTEAYLSMAPNHIYIKHRSKKWGWYNTELTSGEFPSDAWVKASGYITLDAIRSGIYMDTLGQKESIALCIYDLAKGYQIQENNYSDGFILKCCDLALKHNPLLISAIILKAETLKKNFDFFMHNNQELEAQKILPDMQELYVKGLKLGYREMPFEMYLAWLNSAKSGNEKFVNQEINRTFQNR